MISVFVECLIGVYYFDIIFDFGSLVQYGVILGEVQNVVVVVLGGEIVIIIFQGCECFSVIVCYFCEFCDDLYWIGS